MFKSIHSLNEIVSTDFSYSQGLNIKMNYSSETIKSDYLFIPSNQIIYSLPVSQQDEAVFETQ